VELRSNSGALAVACWGYVPQEPVRSSWFSFGLLAENMPYKLTGSILRAQLAAMAPRLHIVMAPSSSWARHVLVSHRNLPYRAVDDPSHTSAAEKTTRPLRFRASSLAQTFMPQGHLNSKPATRRLPRTIERDAIDARYEFPSCSESVLSQPLQQT
jgi:hypothetical protein